MKAVELGVAVLCLLLGARAAFVSLARPIVADSLAERLLIALHESARAGFWFALAAFFLGYALLDEPQGWRLFILAPIGMAGLRLAVATLLARR